MNFWENVTIELEFRRIAKKDFSRETDIPLDSITKGASRGNLPSVDKAFRIARYLDVPLEYLMQENFTPTEAIHSAAFRKLENDRALLFKKHIKLIEQVEKMNDQQKDIIESLIEKLLNL